MGSREGPEGSGWDGVPSGAVDSLPWEQGPSVALMATLEE
jgi:hypothetical protein